MTLKFNRVLEVVNVHVHAKLHQAKYSGSWVIVLTEREKKNWATMLKTILPSLPRAVIIVSDWVVKVVSYKTVSINGRRQRKSVSSDSLELGTALSRDEWIAAVDWTDAQWRCRFQFSPFTTVTYSAITITAAAAYLPRFSCSYNHNRQLKPFRLTPLLWQSLCTKHTSKLPAVYTVIISQQTRMPCMRSIAASRFEE